MVVDDFAPTGRNTDNRLQSVSECLFRAAGNQQGRNRMNGNGRLGTPMPPRALVLATGEEVPQGQSIRARQLILEVGPGDVNRSKLSECQSAGRTGQLSAAMAAFVTWIGGRYQELQEHLHVRVRELRGHHKEQFSHARHISSIAELQAGWELFLRFALDVNAIDGAEQRLLDRRASKAFGEVGILQTKFQLAADPATRFVALLHGALTGGRAHVANRNGSVPDDPNRWGWQCQRSGRKWAPQGIRIGWVIGDDLFLEPKTSYQVAQQLAGSERVGVSEQALRHRLRQQGLLASTDLGRQMLTVRRTLENCPRQVLHLRTVDFGLPSARPGR